MGSALVPFSARQGATKSITVTAVEATQVFPAPVTSELLLTNVGTATVFVRIQATSDATAASAAADMPIAAGATMCYRHGFSESFTVRAIAAGAGSTLYITPGSATS